MNRKNIDNFRFVDLDEFVMMDIEPCQVIVKEGELSVVKECFRVDGITKQGLRIEGLYKDTQSGKIDMCSNFIMKNWVDAKK